MPNFRTVKTWKSNRKIVFAFVCFYRGKFPGSNSLRADKHRHRIFRDAQIETIEMRKEKRIYFLPEKYISMVLSIRKERRIWQNLNIMLYYVTFREDSIWQIKYNGHIFGKCVQIADNSFFIDILNRFICH